MIGYGARKPVPRIAHLALRRARQIAQAINVQEISIRKSPRSLGVLQVPALPPPQLRLSRYADRKPKHARTDMPLLAVPLAMSRVGDVPHARQIVQVTIHPLQ